MKRLIFTFSVLLLLSAISSSYADDSELKWKYQAGNNIYSSPVLDSDGIVYVGSWDKYLYAIKPDGKLKWKYPTGGYIYSSPALGSDGTVYVGSNDSCLYAIKPDGKLKWKYPTDSDIRSSPALGSDGTVYVGSYDGYLYAINLDGTLKWKHQIRSNIYSSPAIGSDGAVYVGNDNGDLYAISPENRYKWKYKTDGRIYSSPALGSDGKVYVGSYDDCLYAINPNGTLNWKYRTGHNISSSPALGSDGTIYVGSNDSCLYAIKPDGKLKWKYQTDRSISSSPALGSDGTIYVGSDDKCLYAINPDGTLKWKYQTGYNIYSSPLLGSDGMVYVGSDDDCLYAIQTESIGYQENSPWPCFGRNSMHTSKACPLLISFDPMSEDIKVLEPEYEYEMIIFIENNSTASMDVTSWTYSDPSATCSLTTPFTISAGETVMATFWIPIEESGLYRPMLTFETNDDSGSIAATKLLIIAPAGSEREHDALVAIGRWKACKKIDPDSIATRNNYGVLLRYAEEYELASEYFEDAASDAVNERYGFTGIKMNIGVVNSDINDPNDPNDPNSAWQIYTDALSGINDVPISLLAPKLWYNKAWEAYAEGDLVTAETLLTQTIDHNEPLDYLKAKACVLRGAIYYKQGNTSAAESDFRNAISFDPDGPIGRMALGNLAEPSGVGVHRLWSVTYQQHFYTIDIFEREALLQDTAGEWEDEGVVYHAFADNRDPNVAPVYRLYSESLNSYFYTISKSERDELVNNINDYSSAWKYEKVAFYVFGEGRQPDDACPVYCFWSDVRGCHFYTIDENERDELINEYTNIWTYEGVAWYAYE